MNLSYATTALLIAAAVAHSPAAAAPLTIKAGESWVFAIERGEPVRARRVAATAKPAAGQIKATVTSAMGTTMTVTNSSRVNYTFRAELIGAAAAPTKPRTCTLPAGGVPVLEYWPVKATAVRLGTFKVASADGNCP